MGTMGGLLDVDYMERDRRRKREPDLHNDFRVATELRERRETA